MAKFFLPLLLAFAGLLPTGASQAADPFRSAKPASGVLAQPQFLPVGEAYRLRASVQDGRVLLEWDIAPGYYLYRDQFLVKALTGSEARPLAFDLIAGEARRIYDEYYEKELEVFYERVQLRAALPVAAPPPVTLAVTSQGCADAGLCYPPQIQYLEVDLPAGSVRTVLAPELPGPAAAGPGLPMLLGFALLGGLILNLMPCVFPVLSIKVMSLTAAHANRGRVIAHGLAYALGVVLSFLAIAVVLIALRGAGLAVGWGFQLQSPGFVTALAYLFFVMALGFAGQLPWRFGLGRLGRGGHPGNGLSASLFTGVLATAGASPCTAPFMGTALGVALTQTTPVALGIFAALGLGMALPFLVLTWLPRLLDRLPAPGPWMETVRQALAFPLYGTALWLLWVLGHQTDLDRVLVVALGMLVVALALWLAARRPRPARIAAVAVLLVGLALPVFWVPERPQDRAWEPFSQARLEQLRADGAPVFVNLTADWCITCLANERLALSSPRFRAALERGGIRYLKGDWTRYDPEITALLRSHGRSGVPLYLLFRPHQEAQILPQLLTETLVLAALADAQASPED